MNDSSQVEYRRFLEGLPDHVREMAAGRLDPADFMAAAGAGDWQRWAMLATWVMARYRQLQLPELASHLRPFLKFESVGFSTGWIPICSTGLDPLFRDSLGDDAHRFSLYLSVHRHPRHWKPGESYEFEELAQSPDNFCSAAGACCALARRHPSSSLHLDVTWTSPEVLPVSIDPMECLPRMLAYHQAWRGLIRLDSRSLRQIRWRWKNRHLLRQMAERRHSVKRGPKAS